MDTSVFQTSESTEKLDVAMAKAQKQIKPAELNCKNPFFNSEYADLASVWRSCRDALSDNGISVTQWPIHSPDNRLYLVTRIAFEGQWIRSTWSVPVSKLDAQGYGSAVTYSKRFALCAAVGVVGDSDDDGNAGSIIKPPITTSKPVINHASPEVRLKSEKPADTPLTPEELKAIQSPNGAVSVTAIVEAQRVKNQKEMVRRIQSGEFDGPVQSRPSTPIVPHVPHQVLNAFSQPGDPPNPGFYVVESGKYKGQRLQDMDNKDLKSYYEWASRQVNPGGPLKNFLTYAGQYLGEIEDEVDAKAESDRLDDGAPMPTELYPPTITRIEDLLL